MPPTYRGKICISPFFRSFYHEYTATKHAFLVFSRLIYNGHSGKICIFPFYCFCLPPQGNHLACSSLLLCVPGAQRQKEEAMSDLKLLITYSSSLPLSPLSRERIRYKFFDVGRSEQGSGKKGEKKQHDKCEFTTGRTSGQAPRRNLLPLGADTLFGAKRRGEHVFRLNAVYHSCNKTFGGRRVTACEKAIGERGPGGGG